MSVQGYIKCITSYYKTLSQADRLIFKPERCIWKLTPSLKTNSFNLLWPSDVKAISHKMLMNFRCNVCSDIPLFKIVLHPPGANELILRLMAGSSDFTWIFMARAQIEWHNSWSQVEIWFSKILRFAEFAKFTKSIIHHALTVYPSFSTLDSTAANY